MHLEYWRVPRLWPGETIFIVGGGPSVLRHDVARLAGRRVVAINASYQAAPFADFLIFTDVPFWLEHQARAEAEFKGRILAVNDASRGRILRLKRRRPEGLTTAPDTVGVEFTTYTAAIDLAYLLGGARFVALGLDGGPAADGRTHHHAPHKHAAHQNFERQRDDLATYAGPLVAAGIEMVNASKGSSVPFWPIVELEAYL